MSNVKDWDTEMGWDRNYAKSVLKDADLVTKVLPILSKTPIEEEIDQVRREGVSASLQVFRNSVLGGIEIKTKKTPVDNVIKVGCHCFGTLLILRYYCLLLQKLGVDYDFLKKEYCCLSPVLYRLLAKGEDRSPIDEAARGFLAANVDDARRLGAKSMVYFCPQCAWRAKWLLSASDMKQLYAFDIIVEPSLWTDKKLRLEKKVAFVSGKYGVGEDRLRIYVPEPVPVESVQLPWQNYRKLLDRVEGLTVIDAPPFSYPTPRDYIFTWAKEQQINTIVVDHPVEYGGLQRMASRISPGTKVRFLADILLEAIGWDPWN